MFSHFSEEFDYSLKKFESMLKTNDTLFFDADEFEQIISYYIDEGKFNLAKKALRVALEQHPDSFSILLMKAEILIIDDENENALELLKNLETIESQNEEVLLLKANLLSKLNQHDASIKILEDLLEFCSDLTEVYNLLGVEYLLIDDYDSANQYYQKCLDIDSQDYTALYNVVFCFDFMDEKQEAVDFLLDFIEQEPYSEIAWHQLGKLYSDMNENEKALDAYDYALIADEYFAGAYIEKAKLLEDQKRYKEAIENYKITIQLDDPTAYAYHRIGCCYEGIGKHTLASQWYKKALHEDPMFDKAWMSLAKVYLSKNNYKQALHFINKAISIDDENSLYWDTFTLISQKIGNESDAAYGRKKSEEVKSIHVDYLLTDIDEMIFEEEYLEAFLMLEEIADIFDKPAEVHYRFAGLYFMLNDLKSSIDHLNLAHQMNPEKVDVFETLFPSIFYPDNFKKLMKGFDDM
jgi:tetratricopeptide (TPR) repeat protein